MLGLGNGILFPNKQMHPTGVQFDRDSLQYINVGDNDSLSFGTVVLTLLCPYLCGLKLI